MNPANEQTAAAATPLLPDKPSALIRLALGDLGKVEGDGRYKVDMFSWHEPNSDGICEVCLAGAVMAGTLKALPHEDKLPCVYSMAVERKLLALDWFRVGSVEKAFCALEIKTPELSSFPDQRIPSYDPSNPAPFHASMRSLADWLEREGF